MAKGQRILNGKSLSSSIVLGKVDNDMQKNKVEPLSYTRNKKLIQKGLKTCIRPKTIQLLEENIGVTSLTLVLVMIFGCDTKSTINKSKNNKLDYNKLKNCCIKK